ncbi:MAG: hypothetical protein DMG97_36375 [Acidobacteria bacterium]|nr:MAG: hypothetical protein DMG97_36375 [Acidobacteriota bacterium]
MGYEGGWTFRIILINSASDFACLSRLRGCAEPLLRFPQFGVEQQFVGSGFAQVSAVAQAAGPRFHS